MYVTAPHVCVSTLSWVAYTPSGGSTRPSGGSRFAVGYPNSPPRRFPWITVPCSVYGRPSRVAASAIAPACTRSRIRVELTGAPSSTTGAMACTGKRKANDDIHSRFFEEGQLFLRITQKLELHAGRQHPEGMRLEGQHDGGALLQPDSISGQLQHGLVPDVHAIEIADGHHREPQACAILEALQHPHSCKARAASLAK